MNPSGTSDSTYNTSLGGLYSNRTGEGEGGLEVLKHECPLRAAGSHTAQSPRPWGWMTRSCMFYTGSQRCSGACSGNWLDSKCFIRGPSSLPHLPELPGNTIQISDLYSDPVSESASVSNPVRTPKCRANKSCGPRWVSESWAVREPPGG